jgi:hypothetical protein
MWTTANPITTSAVTTPTGITVESLNNGTKIYPVAYGTRNFYLYNNAIELKAVTATATCVGGTTWHDLLCMTNAVPTVTTPTATGITVSGATLGANVASAGIPASISERGICMSLSPNPGL